MRILVTGGRNYTDALAVARELHRLAPNLVIEGGATGADRLAREWCQRNGIACATFYAHWAELGNGAGPIRNLWMIEHGYPDMVLAFPGGKGTASCVALARRMGVDVVEVPG